MFDLWYHSPVLFALILAVLVVIVFQLCVVIDLRKEIKQRLSTTSQDHFDLSADGLAVIRVICSACGAKLTAPADAAGRRLTCRECAAQVVVLVEAAGM